MGTVYTFFGLFSLIEGGGLAEGIVTTQAQVECNTKEGFKGIWWGAIFAIIYFIKVM